MNDALEENKEMLYEEKDEEMRDLLKWEIAELEKNIEDYEEKIKVALLPKDQNDEKNIILEIRAWTGWEEAWLFAAELAKSYVIFAEQEWFSVEVSEKSENENGWLKEGTFEIKWAWAYSKFKYESGVHRVQRIPETENKWRVHTSAITVAVLPEIDEIDIEIKSEDIEMTFCRASGAGWQHVNKTDSAVNLRHIPTWITVYCQDGRSQHKNREKAFTILRSRLYAFEEEKRQKERWEERLAQIWSWDRSEKIRTYNFPQDRVTDHRINQNFSWIPLIMTWRLWPIVEALSLADQQRQLENAGKWG
jgi:peptide chain release factor 1